MKDLAVAITLRITAKVVFIRNPIEVETKANHESHKERNEKILLP